MGKPLSDPAHEPNIPIYLGTGSEAMIRLTGEVADGWLTLGFVPSAMATIRPWLEAGFKRAGNGKSFANFEIRRRSSCASRRM